MSFIKDGMWRGASDKGLADRELRCLLAIASGKSDKQIAKEASLSPRTVKGAVERCMHKLNAFRRPMLVAEAFRRGIISPDCPGLGLTLNSYASGCIRALAGVIWIGVALSLAFWLGPRMLTSGHPALVLLAWLLPPAWLMAGLLSYIVWADSGWREDWNSTFKPDLGTPPHTPHLLHASTEART